MVVDGRTMSFRTDASRLLAAHLQELPAGPPVVVVVLG
jgi:hypothetical protein